MADEAELEYLPWNCPVARVETNCSGLASC
jgi:hypothetical protein